MINGNKQEVDGVLDLHGCKMHEAKIFLEDFLNDSIINNYKKIQIIVGKGTHSTDEAVLPNVAKSVLNEYGYTYSYAGVQDGGEGVLEVSLN
jgi:DNA-nicking Smr family endonuclease